MVLDTANSTQERFRIFPNPVREKLQINFPQNTESAHIIIYDVLGKQILETKVIKDNNTINLEYLPSGVYIANLQGPNQKENTFKLIKE